MNEERPTRGPCPDAETLAAFGEGKLARHQIAPVARHVTGCRSCTEALAILNENTPARSPFRITTRLGQALAAAAVIALAFLAMWQWRAHRGTGSEREMLLALAPRAARVSEARLSGGMAWAAYRGPDRASAQGSDPDRLKLGGAVGEVVGRANEEPSAHLEQAAGIGLVLIEAPLEAVSRLRKATELDPNNATAWSDLAAAQDAAALRLHRPSLYPEALASADAALRVDPKLPEALFNRALILERLGLKNEARQAWDAFLAIDASSQWAVEARAHLRELPTTTSEDRFQEDLPRLERAVLAGDAKTVQLYVNDYRQLSRTTAEVLTLGQWGEAYAKGDAATATERLRIARAIGAALARSSKETLLRDAVSAIDAADAQQRAQLAQAQIAYLRGRRAYSRNEPAAAEPDLRRAAQAFGPSPLAKVARYFAASVRFDRNDVDAAQRELSALLTEVDRTPEHAALGAQLRWQLALCAMSDDDWQGALPLLTSARETFVRLGEASNGAFLDALVADAQMALGRADESWQARIRSFGTLSTEGRATRMQVSLGAAATAELRAGRLDVARSIMKIEESTNRAAGNAVLLANTLVREAALSARSGDRIAAAQNAAEAMTVANGISDAAMRTRAIIDADFASGVASLPSDPKRAREHLSKAIDGYAAIERPLFLPETRLLRARASLLMNARDEALRDVEAGIAELERHRVHYAGSVIGFGIFDARTELYALATRMYIERDDAERAFAYAERSRVHILPNAEVREPVAAIELQRRLRGSGAAVLELVVLGDELAAFCVTERGLTLRRRRMAPGLVSGNDPEALYDALIRPSEAELAAARQVIIVPDPLLDGVPFAALRDARTRRHLVERMAVSIAPSATSLQGMDARTSPEAMVAVSLPSGATRSSVALPETEREMREIASLYRGATSLAASEATFGAFQERVAYADVVHIGGHTEREEGVGDAALRFANERVSWRTVAATPLRSKPVVVLAACETLRRPRSRETFTLSLGGGFLAAGASDVIGTLTPIADHDARTFFGMLHRHLRERGDAALALQRAQLEALAAEAKPGSHLPWRSVALLTSRIPGPAARKE